jgi:hypothetical protein
MRIGLYEIGTMPFWCWYEKSSLNYNGEKIFKSRQVGCFEFRKYTSKDAVKKWKNEHENNK